MEPIGVMLRGRPSRKLDVLSFMQLTFGAECLLRIQEYLLLSDRFNSCSEARMDFLPQHPLGMAEGVMCYLLSVGDRL